MKKYTLIQLLSNIGLTIVSDLRYYKKSFGYNALSKNAATLAKDGIIILPGAVDLVTCDKLKAQVLDLVENEDKAKSGTKINHRLGADNGMIDILNIHKSLSDIANTWDQQPVIEIVNEIISPKKAKSLNINSYINRSITHTRGFHADNIAQPQYKAFIYLTDVDDDSFGPFSYVKGSFSFSFQKYCNLVTNRIQGHPPTDMRKHCSKNEIHCIAKKGTLIIANQNGYHRGRPQEEGKERVILVNNILLER